jgi:uncharacterized RDD family membrane protein YckC
MSATQQLTKLAIYVLAAPEDKESCEAIRKHLKAAIRVREWPIPIELTDDFDALPGSDVEEHKRQVLAADIVLSLISVDFIDDDDVYRRNQEVIERYNRNETTIVPILVRVCLWEDLPFSKLVVLPRNHQAVTNKRAWPDEDKVLTKVVEELREMIVKMITIVADPVTPPVETGTDTSAQTIADDLGVEPQRDPGNVSAQDAAPDAPAIDAHVHAIQQEEDVAQTMAWEPPQVPASASVQVAAPVAVHLSREASDDLAVDWRKKYYRRIIWKRGAALALDYFILFVPTIWLLVELGLTPAEDSSPVDAVAGLGIFFLLAPLLEASRWRATPGKRILRLQVTDREGRRISFWRAFVRNILRTLTSFSYVFVLPAIYQYFRFKKTKKLFHDEVSTTLIGNRA